MLRFGPDTGPVAVVAMPLFEEANRCRAFAVTLCRALAKRGLASVLPDLPGQGESRLTTDVVDLAGLRGGFSTVLEHLYRETRRTYSVSLRSGAIAAADAHALGRWHLSPVSGFDLIDALGKTLVAARREHDANTLRNLTRFEDVEPVIEIAGNLIDTCLLRDLAFDKAEVLPGELGVPVRTVRLETNPKPADRHVPGTPLWRRAEPGNDLALAALLADDIADWIAHCEG